ncbi:MAG: filamentous hemagglutinin family protein [Motiliproteus sp.]|jgi:filamentous hemagglutinin family protein
MKHHGSLIRVVRLIWNQTRGCWIAVAANTRRPGIRSKRKLLAAALSLPGVVALSLPGVVALAAPGGGEVVTGSAGIDQSGLTTTITQSSQNLSLRWDSFNIGAAEAVNFVQPGASSIAVNRILDTNGSQILGSLSANGQVFLINPNGILFGRGAQVNVGGLVASALDFNQAGIDGDIRSFSGDGNGAIINQGTLRAANGGYVALLGNSVGNQGTITAPLGSVVLGAGDSATLTFSGNQRASFEIDQSLLNSLVDNGGLIQADGGMVILSAGADTLATNLSSTDIIIETVDGGTEAGDINVDADVTWSAHELKLSAHNDININALMTANDTASLNLQPGSGKVDFGLSSNGFKGRIDFFEANGTTARTGSDFLTIGDNGYNVIGGAAGLLSMNSQSGYYALGSNIDGTSITAPITGFNNSSFDGLGHSISNLNINGTVANTGLFSKITNTTIRNLGLVGGTVTGLEGTGALVGEMTGSSISNSYSTATVDGDAGTGGLVGSSADSDGIIDSYATGNVESVGAGTGGLVGSNSRTTGTHGTITRSFASGNVNGGGAGTGGLVGSNVTGAISQSFAVGDVTGAARPINARSAAPTNGASVGGLAGSNTGALTDTYAAGDVIGYATGVGGLVGANDTGGSVTTSYSSAEVTASGVPGNSGTYALGGGSVTVNDTVWKTGPDGNPVLANISKMLTLSTTSFTKTYDGTAYGDITAELATACCVGITQILASDDVNAGDYNITPELTLSNAALASYFSVAPVALTINKAMS